MGNDKKLTLDEYAMTLIRLKARQLVGKYGFTESDHEDIQQDLSLDLLMRLDRFDARKGRPATFVRMIVDRRVASMIRARKSLSRDFRRAAHSLNELSDEIGDGKLTEPAFDDWDQRDLEIDMAEALDSLSGDLRSIADDLRDETLASAAGERGCSRAAIRRGARQIRQQLAQRGLGEYISSNQNNDASRK